jgi:SOS-response transcriptional repressor LexA
MSQKDRPQLHEVLGNLMKEVGINEAELARKTDIPQPTLHRILSGATKSPRGTSLAPLANFFSVTINQLMGVDELPTDRVAGTHNSRIYGWTPVPLISWEEAANWNKFQHELRSQNWKTWLSTDLAVSDAAFAIKVMGDAMAPTFNEGTILIIEPALTAGNRDYVVAALKEHKNAIFKQLLADGDERYLKSINDQFRTIQMDKSYALIGVLVQARMDYRRDAAGI